MYKKDPSPEGSFLFVLSIDITVLKVVRIGYI
jgi:hypothetical protein